MTKITTASYLEDVPKEWKVTSIRRLIKGHKQGYYSNDGYSENGVKLIRISDLNDRGNITYVDAPYVNIAEKTYTDYKVKKGDILFPRTGSVGLLGYKDDDTKAIFASYLIRFTFNDEFFGKYLKYYLTSYNFRQDLLSNLHGGVNQNIHAENIKDRYILIPPKKYQAQIIVYLDYKTSLIDSLIEKNQKQIELLEEKKKAVINQAVTKGLDPNVKMKNSGVEWIGKIPENWEIAKLKSLTDIFGRIGYRGYTTDDIVYDDRKSAITLSPSNIKDNDLNLEECTYLSWEKYLESPEIMVYRNDIILVKTGSTIGKVAIINQCPKEMTINPQLVVLKNVKEESMFLYYLLFSANLRFQIIREIQGGSTPAINQEKLRNLIVLKPPTVIQKNIAEYLSKQSKLTNILINKIRAQNKLLSEYRTSLISNAVTGKIDVRDEKIPEKYLAN